MAGRLANTRETDLDFIPAPLLTELHRIGHTRSFIGTVSKSAGSISTSLIRVPDAKGRRRAPSLKKA